MDPEIEATEETTATEAEDARNATADAVTRALGNESPEVEPEAKAEPESETEPEPDAEPETETEPEAGSDDEFAPPDGLSDGAKSRFASLVERIKTTAQERDSIRDVQDQIVAMMRSTGYGPQEFADVITMLADANSGDTGRMTKAMERIDALRSTVGKGIGKPVPGVDLFADYPDLKTKVDDGDMDEADAAETASLRRRDSKRAEREARESASRETASAHKQSVAQATERLTAVGNELKSADPDYDAKVGALQSHGFFDRVAETVDPTQWDTVFRTAYDALGDVAAKPVAVSKTQPMRRSVTGAGGSATPTTTADAVAKALAEG